MTQKPHVPPYCNTGVQNTIQNALIALVDWVQVTFPYSQNGIKNEEIITEKEHKEMASVNYIISTILGLNPAEFKKMDTGMYSYRKQLKRGHIRILWDGATADMGIHVEMTGQGCREYEGLGKLSWHELFLKVFECKGHFTRLDIAVDDYKGFFTVKQIVDKLDGGLTSSRFKSYRYMKKGRIVDGKTKGLTVYLGSEKSDIQIRIYDKLLERESAKKEVKEGVRHWVRSEIQLSDKRADMAASQIIYEKALKTFTPIGMVVAGILKNYVTFYEKASLSDKNKSRWEVWKRWKAFLGQAAKLKLAVAAPDQTIETQRAWIDKQTSKTVAKLFLAYNSDLEWLIDNINHGMELLDSKDLDQIETYKRNKELIDKYIQEIKEDERKQYGLEGNYTLADVEKARKEYVRKNREKTIESVVNELEGLRQEDFSSFNLYLERYYDLDYKKKELEMSLSKLR